jgi:hypothetical protein
MLRLPLEGPRITRQLPHHAETFGRLQVRNILPISVLRFPENADA